MKKQAGNEPTASAVPPLGEIPRINGQMMDGLARVSEIYARAFADFQAEMANFINTRLSQDGELAKSLSSCENWTEASQLQQEWALKTMQDYLREASELARLGARFTNGTLNAFQTVNETTASVAEGRAQAG